MKSFQTLYNYYTSLSQNTSTSNIALGKQMINDTHRYLLQKYFSNEMSYGLLTQGGQDATLTAVVATASTSATLNTAWTGNTVKAQVTFSSGEIRMAQFLTNSTAISWDAPLTTNATTAIEIGAQQFYPLPPNYSKLKTITITIGNLQWTLDEILTRLEWDQLNVFPYYADIPAYFYIYPGGDHGGQIGIWPIPSTTGNMITINYKYRIPDLSMDDYTTPGTASISNKSQEVSGTGTTFIPTTNFSNESRWIQFAQPVGDSLWYQIAKVNSTTSITLYQPYQGIDVSSATASTYTIGQMPILPEDFHDLLAYRPLYIYFSSINPNAQKAKEFKALYEDGEKRLAEYSGSNTIDVNLSRRAQRLNPNLFPQSIGSES